MDRAVQLVALIVLVVSGYMYLQERGVGPASPEVEQLRATGVTSEDACLIASYVRTYGDMVLEDGARDEPYIKTIQELKLKLRDIGNLVVGTGWKIGDRYPALPPVLAEQIQVDTLDRQVFHAQATTLAGLLEKV